MLDFKKLMDPAYKEELRIRREEQERIAEAHEKVLRDAVDLLDDRDINDLLGDKERSLVRNCRFKLSSFGILSEPQEKWLMDIASRFRTPAQIPADQVDDRKGLLDLLQETVQMANAEKEMTATRIAEIRSVVQVDKDKNPDVRQALDEMLCYHVGTTMLTEGRREQIFRLSDTGSLQVIEQPSEQLGEEPPTGERP